MVTFFSDRERHTVFLADERAATYLTCEDGAFRNMVSWTRWFTWVYNADASFVGVIANIMAAQ